MTRARSVFAVVGYSLFMLGFLLLLVQNRSLRSKLSVQHQLLTQPAGLSLFRIGDTIQGLTLTRSSVGQIPAVEALGGGEQIIYFFKASCESCLQQRAAWSAFFATYGPSGIMFVDCSTDGDSSDGFAPGAVSAYDLVQNGTSRQWLKALPQLIKVDAAGSVVGAFKDVDSLILAEVRAGRMTMVKPANRSS